MVNSTPSIVNRIESSNGLSQIEFIDISGKLSNYVGFEVEILAESIGFLEGPVWIDIDVNNPYLLFVESFQDSVWKYDINQNNLELLTKLNDGCTPTAIAWNKNFFDEIWITCFYLHSILQIDLSTLNIIYEYNEKSYHPDRDTKFNPNDIAMDDMGNIYFSDMPIERNKETGSRGGVYSISRLTNTISLINFITYGPNGITFNKDQTLLVVANFFDVPIKKWNIKDYNQYNWRNVRVRGYRKENGNKSSSSFERHFEYYETHIKPFYDYMLHDKYDMFFDSNAFDNYDNLWQAVYFNDATEGGQISILRNDGNTAHTAQYIGSIRVMNPIYSPSNLERGNDGYMYATCGDYNSDKGSLLRFKLKELDEKEEL